MSAKMIIICKEIFQILQDYSFKKKWYLLFYGGQLVHLKFMKILKWPTVLVSELVSFAGNSEKYLSSKKKYGGIFHYPLMPQYHEK